MSNSEVGGPYYLYSYKQVKSVETLVEARKMVHVVWFTKHEDWKCTDHEATLAVKDSSHYLKNVIYKEIKRQINPDAIKLSTDFNIFPQWATFTIKANIKEKAGGNFKFQITGEEYKLVDHVTEFTSKLINIVGDEFSIIVPAPVIGVTSELTFIEEGGDRHDIDPFTFTNAPWLMKLSMDPEPDEKVKITFKVL